MKIPTAPMVDRPGRALTDRERRMQELHTPVLALWSIYLTAVPCVETLADGIVGAAPVLCRPHRHGINPMTNLPYLSPVLVNPRLVEHALRSLMQRRDLPPGLGSLPGWGRLSEALEFMGLDYDSVRRSSSQRPVGEPHTWGRPYRRQGWWQLSGEVWQRLTLGRYVPVLTPLMGRPASRSALIERRTGPDPLPHRARPRAHARDRELAVRTLTDYLRTTEPTCLMATAVAQGRPLVVRRAGRPARGATEVPVRTDAVVVSALALAEHAQRASTRLELPMIPAWWTRHSAAALLDVLVDTEAVPVVAMPRFSPMDVGRPTKYAGWYRVSLAWAGAPELDVAGLTAEWEEHVAAREAAALSARAAAAAAEVEFEREFRFGEGVEETRA